MDKWKILKEEVHAESMKAMKNKDLPLYLALNKIWMRMIELTMEDEKLQFERINKKFDSLEKDKEEIQFIKLI